MSEIMLGPEEKTELPPEMKPEPGSLEWFLRPLSPGFCNCPDNYSVEEDDFHGKQTFTVYVGRCPHRHGYNILGRIPKVEVDKRRLDLMVEMANVGLEKSR